MQAESPILLREGGNSRASRRHRAVHRFPFRWLLPPRTPARLPGQNRICDGNLPSSQQTINGFSNTACFVAPPLYTFGNAGRNILIGLGLGTWDLGADKDFALTERFGLQFRSEFFNVLNRANFGLPNGSIGSTAQGTITSVITNARQIQFALRLHW
jgi:hypothetical protein